MFSIDQAGSFHSPGRCIVLLVCIVYKRESQTGMAEQPTLVGKRDKQIKELLSQCRTTHNAIWVFIVCLLGLKLLSKSNQNNSYNHWLVRFVFISRLIFYIYKI